MSYTPGPWKIGAAPPNGQQTIGDCKGMMVAVATTGVNMDSETLANARLIAAAPELVEALEDAIAGLEMGEAASRSQIALDCRALLARIKGEA